jgi:ABC-type multidrug transport system ATPase subunit
MTLLSAQNLHKSFGGVVAARDVAFTVERSEMLAVIGPNGAGKSTVFNMVGGCWTGRTSPPPRRRSASDGAWAAPSRWRRRFSP